MYNLRTPLVLSTFATMQQALNSESYDSHGVASAITFTELSLLCSFSLSLERSIFEARAKIANASRMRGRKVRARWLFCSCGGTLENVFLHDRIWSRFSFFSRSGKRQEISSWWDIVGDVVIGACLLVLPHISDAVMAFIVAWMWFSCNSWSPSYYFSVLPLKPSLLLEIWMHFTVYCYALVAHTRQLTKLILTI